MDYKALLHAVALADEGSFVRAAEKVSLTQSALSRSIIALERDLGAILFDRLPAGVKPTPAGRIFIERARRILADTRALKDEISHGHGDMAGAIALGAVPALGATVLPRLLAWCVDRFPKLQISARVDTPAPLFEQLRRGNIEFFMTIEGAGRHDADLEQRPLGTIRGGALFCRAGHPLAGRATLRADDLRPFPLAVAAIDKPLGKTHRELIGIDDDSPMDFRIVCDNLFVLQRVAAASDALLITSQGGMQELVDAGTFVELAAPDTATVPEAVTVLAVTMKGRSISPAAARLIDKIEELL